MKNFWIRTLSATVYAALFVFCIYATKIFEDVEIGAMFFIAFTLFVTVGGTFEFFRIVEMQGAKPMRTIGYITSILTCLVVSLASMCKNGTEYNIYSTFIVIYAVLLFLLVPTLLIAQLWRMSDQPIRDITYTLFPAIYIGLPLGLMPFTAATSPNLMMSILALVWINDSFAYIGGSLYGKHKMWPRHSPGKTWEGTATGVVIACLVAVFVGPLFVKEPEIHWSLWLAIALICSIIGTLGDLVESMLKRSVGLKDSGNIMPGHGGFLDRFDSLLIIMPFIVALRIICRI